MKRLVALAVVVWAGGCGRRDPAPPSAGATPGEVWLSPQQVKDGHIEIEVVQDRPVGGTIRAAGRVTFDDLRVAHVFSPVTGRISKILAQPGERVKQGQALCVAQCPDLASAGTYLAKAQSTLLT